MIGTFFRLIHSPQQYICETIPANAAAVRYIGWEIDVEEDEVGFSRRTMLITLAPSAAVSTDSLWLAATRTAPSETQRCHLRSEFSWSSSSLSRFLLGPCREPADPGAAAHLAVFMTRSVVQLHLTRLQSSRLASFEQDSGHPAVRAVLSDGAWAWDLGLYVSCTLTSPKDHRLRLDYCRFSGRALEPPIKQTTPTGCAIQLVIGFSGVSSSLI